MKKYIAVSLMLVGVGLSVSLPRESWADSGRNKNLADTIKVLNGSPAYLGTIVATTTKNNSDTAAPFAIEAGQFILVQCDVAAYVLPGTSTAAAATTANGVKVAADEKFYILLRAGQSYLAIISASGTATCKVWGLS